METLLGLPRRRFVIFWLQIGDTCHSNCTPRHTMLTKGTGVLREGQDMKHRKVSDPLTSWFAIAAALVVLFSTMLDAHVAFILSISMALTFAMIRVIQSSKLLE